MVLVLLICYVSPCVKHYSVIGACDHPAVIQDLKFLSESSVIGMGFTLTDFGR